MLIIFGGLPGSGKSTVAQALAQSLKAVYLRVDTIEQAIRSSLPLAGEPDIGASGYVTLYRVAAENLRLGHSVITDSVNPIEITRKAFRNVALEAGRRFIEIEIHCSDTAIHRHRAETRIATIAGLKAPTWANIQAMRYDVWQPDLRLDTASLSVEESVAQIMTLLAK